MRLQNVTNLNATNETHKENYIDLNGRIREFEGKISAIRCGVNEIRQIVMFRLSIFGIKQMNNKDVAISTMVDENTNIYPPTFAATSFVAVELVMWPKHQEQATEPEPNICPIVRPSLEEIYPNTMFFIDSCQRSSLKSSATLATHAKNLVKSTPTFGLNDQQARLKCS